MKVMQLTQERGTERNDETKDGKDRLFIINPLNAELYTICHLLALLGAHHILHVNRIRVKI
jgi:hypothetical protein